MENITLNNNIKCPIVGIGTFMHAPANAENSVREALKMGYRLIDTANAYVNERAVGRGMKDSEEARYQKRAAMCAQRLEDLKAGEYKLGGGVVDPLPSDAPFFVKDYYDYYKTDRGYHKRSLNSNGGWNVIGCESFVNQPILKYSNEIRSAVLLVHGEKAHSCYFSKDAYADMIKDSKYADNKELMIIPNAVHTDLYDGGDKDYIPFDKLESFFKDNLK